MIVRRGKGTDYPRLASLIDDAHARSNIAAYPQDERFRREFCLQLMFANLKAPAHDAACIFVAERNDVLQGLIIPAACRLYVFGRDLIVSDLMFFTRADADAHAAPMLWAALETWADVPDVVAIRPSVTNAIGDPERTAKFFEVRGYERMGLLFEKRRPLPVAARRVA